MPLILLALAACSTSPEACLALSVDACATAPGCAILDGSELAPPGVDDTATCWTVVSSASVGCVSAESTCPAVEAYAQNPTTGACWWFPTGCTPQGWGDCVDGEPDAVCP